jgi:hypothetical protein
MVVVVVNEQCELREGENRSQARKIQARLRCGHGEDEALRGKEAEAEAGHPACLLEQEEVVFHPFYLQEEEGSVRMGLLGHEYAGG